MSEVYPFIVGGLVTGSIYGLAAMGLVLTYKTSGIFNFAHGAVATLGAYTYYKLAVEQDWHWTIALFFSVVVVGIGVGFVLERLARALGPVSAAMQVVATVGLLLLIQSVISAVSGHANRNVPPYFPTDSVRIGGVNVGVDQMIVFGIAAASAIGLYLFFRSTQLGLAMQAVVDDPALLAMGGRSPVKVRTLSWMIGSVFACLSGVLLVPTVGLEPSFFTLLVVQAFGAAAVGFFSSLPLTYAGGLLVGVLAELSKYVGTYHLDDKRWFSGVPSSIPFLVLFAVLLAVPRHRLVALGAQVRLAAKPPPQFPLLTRATASGALLLALVLVPFLVGAKLTVYTNGLILVVVFLSLHLLVRTSGQVSLAHASFAAVGAASFSHLLTDANLPWLLALVCAGLIAVPVGALVAIPAIRLSGLYLAVATFGFAILVERLFFPTELMFGVSGAIDAPRSEFWKLDSDKGYYYTVLVVAILMAALATFVIRSRLGRLLRAMSDSPMALSTHGTNVNVSRVLIFCISAFMAGIAGGLMGSLVQSINGHSFGYFLSLQWLAVLAISGVPFKYAPVPTAILAGASLAVVPVYIDSQNFNDYLPAIFGLAAILNALMTDRHQERAETEEGATPERPGRAGRRHGRGPVAERMAREARQPVAPVG